MNGFDIGETLYEILKKSDYPIYPIIAPLDTKFPYVVYRRENLKDHFTKDKDWEAVVEIICASDTYIGSISVAKEVYQLLKESEVDFSLEESYEDWVDNAYVQSLKINIIQEK